MSNILFDKEAFKSSVKNNVRTLYRKTLSETSSELLSRKLRSRSITVIDRRKI